MIVGKRMDWGKLLNEGRFPRVASEREEASSSTNSEAPGWLVASRTETERDFDRILFASPVRRLGDKTQVFPLEKNEHVRNRLTHSHEVSNLARSIGTHLVNSRLGERIVEEAIGGSDPSCGPRVRRAIPAMLAAVGLAHDLGNPPFGHQGEAAIRDWVARNENAIFNIGDPQRERLGDAGSEIVKRDLERLTVAQREDLRRFEGNAQTFRTVTRLQVVKDNRGLNLTFGTLAALMKYIVSSDHVVQGGGAAAAARKVGYFASEATLVERVRSETGLDGRTRHPLTHIMEACDDVAYLIVDAEDAVKKQIVSFHDMMAWLRSRSILDKDELAGWVLGTADRGAASARQAKLTPGELNDVSMQIFRAGAITAMVSAVICAFEQHYEDIMTVGIDRPLIELSTAAAFAREMKDFDRQHAYVHRRVLELELEGHNTIQELMDMLWTGITEREDYMDVASRRSTPFSRYAYGRLSENYKRVFEERLPGSGSELSVLPVRYRELQLLTDMVAGMTDQYALDLHKELKAFHVGAPAI